MGCARGGECHHWSSLWERGRGNSRAASRWEAAQIPNEADDGGRGQKSDAGNGEKSLHLRKLLGERLELVLDASALVLELSNLGARIISGLLNQHLSQKSLPQSCSSKSVTSGSDCKHIYGLSEERLGCSGP